MCLSDKIEHAFVCAFQSLWSATDYPSSRRPMFLDDESLSSFLGMWPDIRRACDEIAETAARERPDVRPKRPFA